MTLIADLDLDLLKDLNTSGAVRNLRDRRKELYSVSWVKKNTDRSDDDAGVVAEEKPAKTPTRRKAIAAG